MPIPVFNVKIYYAKSGFAKMPVWNKDRFMSYLKQVRESMKKTQAELGDMVGASQSQIGRLESGEREMNREWALKLSKATGISPVKFVFPDDNYLEDAELVEIVDKLSRLGGDDRKVAFSILRPFLTSKLPG